MSNQPTTPRPSWQSLALITPTGQRIVRAQEADEGAAARRQPSVPETLTSVLLVDEDDLLMRLLAHQLRRAGFRVETASSSRQAKALLLEDTFGLVVTSLSLEGQTGVDLILDLREDESYGGLSILAVQKIGGDAALELAFQSGADDLLRYPFAPTELVLRARALSRSAARIHQLRSALRSA
ncbi:MAG: response regulator [Rhodothermales bacterium]|nr:response regulator [Rhodothermales bacterium]